MFDQLIRVLQEQNLNVLPLAISSLKDKYCLKMINQLIEQCSVSLVLNTTAFAGNKVNSPELSSQPHEQQDTFVNSLPVLQLILSSSTQEDWSESTHGLRSRDLAMQVALPEMDGRIITRVLSFKNSNERSERCQIDIIRYVLHKERARFVSRLAFKMCQLSRIPNKNKSVAIVLANYPTKDGRIGNGVGLDTPASAIEILNALKNDDYDISDIPSSGNELIELLQQAITNNPNSISRRPCWQSIALDEYDKYFAALPLANQHAVTERWGPAENDPKHRSGRLMLSGMRLGKIFVGIQPARGFNVDLQANYHDPDLVPPHSYLAFYFWLRHCFGVNAVIHVGKHGNLEWLPGKGSGLSQSCWPDIALGPLPHFYPFIVNDPGEGAQAKRRAQAVIIDHLMPPMARAESYGELQELEGLVDEYYQALGLDSRRENWLRDKILKLGRSSHVLEELQKDSADEDFLAELDTYLCDIKEAQIRNGLHILGNLPNSEKLADTIVALLRLPRGEANVDQGLLHNIAFDLNLRNTESGFDGAFFNPLKAISKPWSGLRPTVLEEISDVNWRSELDTRERLELLANFWISEYVLEGKCINTELQKYPRTCEQLNYCKNVLLSALTLSAEMELNSLLSGLAGKFVPAGPSGAPTRGRLDTLPTGRNFYSVDNRSIPSTAAWALGKISANTLIERYLQEHGDYPKQLGLSVWGTATMRTGGDDIAQAFALMGVKPIWAAGSQRVIDFEIISSMQLGRPRVDVTLRVSGFFRDAFANVMKLFDAAVIAIAEIEEPGSNTIRDNIQARANELEHAGLSSEEAFRQASFRVFGSKPGAYGAGLQGLIDERCWRDKSDLASAYVNWGAYAYGKQNNKSVHDGVQAVQAFEHQLSQIEIVLQNQDNREHDILDSDDYYQFQGGMSNAVRVLSKKEAIIYHADHSNPAIPKIRSLKEELNRVIRSRVLNPKWI